MKPFPQFPLNFLNIKILKPCHNQLKADTCSLKIQLPPMRHVSAKKKRPLNPQRRFVSLPLCLAQNSLADCVNEPALIWEDVLQAPKNFTNVAVASSVRTKG